MTPLEFVILGLATWRVSALFSKEAGPFDVFKRIRELAGIQHDADGNVFMIPHKLFAELLSCVWCTSIWVGAFWAVMWFVSPPITIGASLLFAISTVAIIIDKLV
jgi:hypothetical protein